MIWVTPVTGTTAGRAVFLGVDATPPPIAERRWARATATPPAAAEDCARAGLGFAAFFALAAAIWSRMSFRCPKGEDS